MPAVQISEPTYDQARRVADASGVSVERLIEGLLKFQLAARQEEPDRVPPAELAKAEEGLRQIEAGDFLTLEQVREELAANRATWNAVRSA